MTPNLLDELEKIVALSEKATPGEWSRDWNNDVGPNDDYYVEWEEVGPVQIHGQNARADAEYLHALHNWFRTHAPTLADMAKRMEAAERDAADARRYRSIKDTYGGWQSIGGIMQADIRTPIWRGDWPSFDAAIDAATQEGEG